MCGIAGFIEFPGAPEQEPRARLSAMLRAVAHRGPDDWGSTYFGFAPASAADGERGVVQPGAFRVALGHRRLSILDLSVNGRQPMATADGAVWVVFNGEIYNYVELRRELCGLGERFSTGTDTEVLLASYRRWGVEMLERFDGIFAFALLDRERGRLLCARDPLGVKPFYWAHEAGAFWFASEPRAVLAGIGEAGHIDREHVAEFLVYGMSDHDDGTFWRELRQLPGGHWMAVSLTGEIGEPSRYWRPPVDLFEGDDVPERLREALHVAVTRQLRSDVAVGSALSGGLDSGAITASVGELMGREAGRYTAITLSSPNFEDDESELARLTSDRAGVRWVGVEPRLDALPDELERMAVAMGEPFSSLSMFAGWKVMEKARDEGLKVMLDGQGGDELYVGYGRVVQRILPEHLRSGRPVAALREWRSLARNANLPMSRTALGNLFFRSPTLAAARNRRRLHGLVDPDLLAAARLSVAQDLYAPADMRTVQIDELTRFCLPRLLRYEDRNSMAFGVEARVPHLGVELLDFALRLPPHWQVRDGWTKYALRRAMEGRLDERVLHNPVKRGFDVPQSRWIAASRARLGDWLADLPEDAPIRRDAVLSRLDRGDAGALWLWRVLSVALWMRLTGVRP